MALSEQIIYEAPTLRNGETQTELLRGVPESKMKPYKPNPPNPVEQNRPLKIKRYNLAIPEPLYENLQEIADREGASVVDVLRVFIKTGLLIDKVTHTSNGKFLLRENNTDQEIRLVF